MQPSTHCRSADAQVLAANARRCEAWQHLNGDPQQPPTDSYVNYMQVRLGALWDGLRSQPLTAGSYSIVKLTATQDLGRLRATQAIKNVPASRLIARLRIRTSLSDAETLSIFSDVLECLDTEEQVVEVRVPKY